MLEDKERKIRFLKELSIERGLTGIAHFPVDNFVKWLAL